MKIHGCGLIVVTLVLAACSIGRAPPEVITYLIEPRAALPVVLRPRRPDSLRVNPVRVAAAFSSPALVYRLDEVRYVTDSYHAFVIDPGAMLSSQIAQWLDDSGPFGHAMVPGSARTTPFALDVAVTELYGDFRPGAPPAAVVNVQFVLWDERAVRPKVLYEHTIARRIASSHASANALVRGYGSAWAQILEQLAQELDVELAAIN